MTFLERTTDARKLRHWEGNMEADYIYTSGVAGEEGRVAALTVAHLDREGVRLSRPQVWAFVTFQGIRGGLVHRLLVPPGRARVGLAVRPKLKAREDRVGAITDIEGFEPVGS